MSINDDQTSQIDEKRIVEAVIKLTQVNKPLTSSYKKNFNHSNLNFINLANAHKNKKELWWRLSCYLALICLSILFFCIGSYYNFPNQHFNAVYSHQNLIIEFEMTVSGLGIGVVGGALQSTTRNDLSGPTTLGFIPAIILGIYIPIIAAGNSENGFFNRIGAKFLFGILFAFLLLLVNFLLTRRSKNLKNNYVPLLVGFSIGVIISVICILLSNYKIAIQNSGYTTVGIWGGIEKISSNVTSLEYGAPLTLIPTIIIISLSKYLNIVEKDPAIAKSMGVNADAIYWVVGILSVMIIASSILMVGSILLLAIVAPHLARKVFKTTNYAIILPFSAITCAMLLNLSYVVTQADTTIGINLIPIIFCAPIFIFLLRRR